jgi:hypothetical protein
MRRRGTAAHAGGRGRKSVPSPTTRDARGAWREAAPPGCGDPCESCPAVHVRRAHRSEWVPNRYWAASIMSTSWCKHPIDRVSVEHSDARRALFTRVGAAPASPGAPAGATPGWQLSSYGEGSAFPHAADARHLRRRRAESLRSRPRALPR